MDKDYILFRTKNCCFTISTDNHFMIYKTTFTRHCCCESMCVLSTYIFQWISRMISESLFYRIVEIFDILWCSMDEFFIDEFTWQLILFERMFVNNMSMHKVLLESDVDGQVVDGEVVLFDENVTSKLIDEEMN